MAVANEWSDVEIENLCNAVCGQHKKSPIQGVDDYLKLLRRICGRSDCSCSNWTLQQRLSHLLSLSHSHFSVGHFSNLAFEGCSQSALENVLRHLLCVPKTKARTQLLDRLWTHPGLRNFRVDVIEDFLNCESKYIEADIIDIFQLSVKKNMRPEYIWEDTKFERIVFWSCNSSRIFFVVTSVLHSWLLRISGSTECYTSCVNIVRSFINGVKLKCNQDRRDFVLLYPSEYHKLVSLLDINPDVFPMVKKTPVSINRVTVIELIKQNLDSTPLQTLCLLTHFPQWSLHINS